MERKIYERNSKQHWHGERAFGTIAKGVHYPEYEKKTKTIYLGDHLSRDIPPSLPLYVCDMTSVSTTYLPH